MTGAPMLQAGSGPRPFDIDAVEAELRAMWQAAAGGRDGAAAIYRAAMSNLVVLIDPELHRRLAPALVETTRRHPSRLLLVEIAEGGASPELIAEVAALCHLRPGGGCICSEQVILRGESPAGALVPSAVRALLVGNLPLVLLALRRTFTPWLDELADRADLVLPDSGIAASLEDARAIWARIEEDRSGVWRDLAWTRLTPWRSILAEAFDAAHRTTALPYVRDVTIEFGAAEPVPSCALLLAAWLASRLQWTPRGSDGRTHRLDGPNGDVRIRLSPNAAEPDAGLQRVRLEAGGPDPFQLQVIHRGRDPNALVEVANHESCRQEVPFVHRDLATCVVAEIHRHEPNPLLRDVARLARDMVPPHGAPA